MWWRTMGARKDRIAMLEDLQLIDGFHGLEQDEHGPFVWTRGKFRVRAARIAPFVKLQLCYYGEHGRLAVRDATGTLVDEVELLKGWHRRVLRLGDAAAGPLNFQVSPVMPVPGESRELGMMLRGAELFEDKHRYQVLTKSDCNLRLNERKFRAGVTRLTSFPPQLRVTMEVRCNLPETSQACVYCAWDFAKNEERGSPAFTYQTLEDLGDFYDCATEIVDCSIGEPTMKKDFGKIIGQMDLDGKFISLTTNGQLLGEGRRREMLGKNMCIYVSIDSATAEGYSRYRNKRFDDIVRNLSTLCRDKKQHNNLPRVFTTFLVMRSNIAELPEYLDLMKEIGVDEVKLRSLNLDNLDSQANVLNNGYQFNYIDEVLSMEELAASIRFARRLADERGVVLYNETLQFAAGDGCAGGRARKGLGGHCPACAKYRARGRAARAGCRASGAAPASPPLTASEPVCSEPWKTMYFLRRHHAVLLRRQAIGDLGRAGGPQPGPFSGRRVQQRDDAEHSLGVGQGRLAPIASTRRVARFSSE